MKYFLGIKNGGVKHEFIPLDKLDERVNANNNLRALCTYTMTFSSEEELKRFLMAKNIVKKDISKSKLEIVYRRKYQGKTYSYYLDVPYKKHEKYLNYGSLAGVIASRCLKYPAFLKFFLDSYSTMYNGTFGRYPSEEFYQLRNKGEYADSLELYDLIRRFLSKECYRKGKSGRVFSFLNLYNVAFTAIKVEEVLNKKTFKGSNLEIQTSDKKEDISKIKIEEEKISQELDGQMKLF